jgi:MYXO-CTERM domain-containing protein
MNEALIKYGKTLFTALGVTPTAQSQYSHSPHSGANHTEGSAQLLGTGSWSFPDGVTRLEFIDWPAHIAISNLKVSDSSGSDSSSGGASAPEPGSWLLLALGLAGLPFLRRSLKGRSAPVAPHGGSTP